jgi:hypothetical protein
MKVAARSKWLHLLLHCKGVHNVFAWSDALQQLSFASCIFGAASFVNAYTDSGRLNKLDIL